MKHSTKITAFLLLLFFFAQIIGLAIVAQYVDVAASASTGSVQFQELPSFLGFELDRPDVEQSTSFAFIFMAVLVGTLLILAIIRFGLVSLWKAWFFFAVVLCLTVAFGAWLPDMYALGLGVALAFWKVFRRSLFVQNITELFLYGGLAVIFVPVINIVAMFGLLLLISFYDMYAVWKSKHMIKMAKFQTASGVFAGLLLPYVFPSRAKPKKRVRRGKAKVKVRSIRTAVLGGGDIGFPLIFTGVVFKTFGFFPALIITPFTTASLGLLLYWGNKDKFYPAMPFISLGCLAGYMVMLLVVAVSGSPVYSPL